MTDRELQLRMLYAIIVAGKSAKFAERAMIKLFSGLEGLPFDLVRKWIGDNILDIKLRSAKVGNYGKITRAFKELVISNIDLRLCSPADLENIYGIGPKTARFFIIWSRPAARVAALDVHVLRWLRNKGYNATRQTPTGKKYAELETIFLAEADKLGLSPHELDRRIWSNGSQYDQENSFISVSNLVGGRNGNGN